MKTKAIILLSLIAAFAANPGALAEPGRPQRLSPNAVQEGLSASDWASVRQQAYLKASNTGQSDQFAHAVAVSGDTVVVGAQYENSNATGVNGNHSTNSAPDSGAAYVFVRSGSTWVQQAYLKASNTGAGDRFGYAVAVSDDTVVVGAVLEASDATGVNGNQSNNNAIDSGAAYVFVRNGTNWSQQAYLKASNTGASDLFGDSLAVSGDTVVVSAFQEASNATGVNGNQSDNSAFGSGAAYVFVRTGTNWSQQAYLKASNTEAGDRFFYVTVSGDTIVVGAHQEDSNATGVNGNQSDNSATNSGAAYVFVRNGTNWSQQAYLKAPNTGVDDRFGWAVSVSDDTVVVGAHFEDSNATGVNGNQSDNSATDSGAAYVFVRSGTNWSQQAYLKASNTGAGDEFGGGPGNSPGTSVAVSGETVVIGASFEASNATGVNGDGSNNSAFRSGAAYIFRPAPTITAQPTNQVVFTGSNATFNVTATTANPPIRYQWRFNGADLPGATNDSLTITNAQLVNAGDYQVVLTDAIGFTGSTPATLALLDAVKISAQPQNQSVLRGASALFSVSASSGSPLNYQWQFNATDLPGETNSTLTVTNVQAANVGNYTVIMTTIYTSVTSAVATLELRIPPTITQQPQPITVVVGEKATFTVTVTNTATLPIHYQWRKGSIPLTNILLHSTTSSFTLYNVQTNVTTTNGPGGYRVAISNAATTGIPSRSSR